MTYDEASVAATIAQLLHRTDIDATSDGTLDALDQYHVGGSEAVDLLVETLHLTATDSILDVGSGFGGPARQIARRTGASVTGIDLAPGYVEAARLLTAQARLGHQVDFLATDVADHHPASPYDAAITLHVQMNVADKVAWFARIADRLVDGGRLAVWEVCQPACSELTWPMPWSLDGSDSFLTAEQELREAIEGAGFTTDLWVDRTAWTETWFEGAVAAATGDRPALPMVIEDGYTRVLNLAGAVAQGAVQVWQGAFTKGPVRG